MVFEYLRTYKAPKEKMSRAGRKGSLAVISMLCFDQGN